MVHEPSQPNVQFRGNSTPGAPLASFDRYRDQRARLLPACNTPPVNSATFGIIYRDMVHVSDMRALLGMSDINYQNFSTVGFSSPISRGPFYAWM